MEKEKNEIIIKPQFTSEIKAEIKGLPEIEDNIMEVKSYAEKLNSYYSSVTWTEDTLQDAKNEKSNVNKFKDKVAEFRKSIITKYKEPIDLFETTAKQTESILKDTYDNINNQVKKYEDDTKEKIKNKCIEYFEEYKLSKHIDFITFDNMNINITLGMQTKNEELTKSIKEDIADYINKIADDLTLIDTQEHKTEILVEYKQSLNVATAITNVNNRFKAIEEEKTRQEELLKVKEQEQQVIEKVEEFIMPVVQVPVEDAEVNISTIDENYYTMAFKVTAKKWQLKELKEFMEKKGIEYE